MITFCSEGDVCNNLRVWVTCVFSHVHEAQSDDVSGLVIGGNR